MADYQFNTNLGPAAQQGTNLGDLVNMARGIQAFQQAEQINPLALQKAQMEINQLQKMNPLSLEKAQEEVNQAKIGTQSAQTKFGAEKMQRFMDTVGSRVTDQQMLDAVKNKDSSKVKDLISSDIQDLITHKVLSPAEAMQAGARMLDLADKDINAVVPALKNLVTRAASPESRLGLQTGQVTTNATGQLVNVKPAVNQVNVLGGTQGQIPMPANPSQAQANLVNKAAEVAGGDYAASVQDSTGAQGRIATFQNIKRLAPEAFTGVGGERKKLVSGIAQAVGIPLNELETSSTDELAKNTKLLALTGGNTDAARGIAELATPNAKMTKEAINRVADQLIGIERMKLAKTQFLSPYVNNPTEYANKLMQFGNVADFRIFQETTPEEVAKLKKSMSPAARQEMSRKIEMARQLGIIQ